MRKKIAILGLILILGLGKLAMAEVWERIIPFGNPPSKRNGHVLIQQFVFGGFDQDNNLWILWQEIDTWRWENRSAGGEAPGPRGGHSGIFAHGLDNSIIIFGGSQSPLGAPSDIVTYRLENPWDPSSTWEKFSTEGSTPTARAEHTAVYDEGMNRMVVFGGYTDITPEIVASSETYTLDFNVTPASWTKVDTSGEIPARYGHSAVWANWRMVVFGGKDSSDSLLDDCWELVESTWTKISVTGDKPPARWQHTAVWIPGEFPGGMLIFGGKDEQGNPLDDVWFLQEPDPGPSPDNWKWEKLYPIGDLPSARSGHVAGFVWNGDGGGMFIFGGSDGNNNLNDVYVLSEGEKVEQSLQKKPFNAPNPFNPDREETKICYYLDDAESNVKIKLFTLTGELVYSWENISGRKGMNQWPWNGKNEKGRVVENGGYICLIEAGGEEQKCKIAVLR